MLANIICLSMFAKDPDYMSMNYYDAAKTWHYFQDSNVVETFRQYRKFIHAFAGKFPLDHVRKRAEEAAYHKVDAHEKVIKYFEFNPVLTSKGLIVYVKALLKTNQQDQIRDIVRKYWLGLEFKKSEIEQLIKFTKPHLKTDDYKQKLSALIAQEKHELAEHFCKYADAQSQAICMVRLSIQKSGKNIEYAIKNGKNADQAAYKFKSHIEKYLSNYQNNSDVLLDIVRWYRRAYQTKEAIKLLKTLNSAKESESPLPWWNERNILARRMMEDGNWKEAYRIISHHKLKKGEAFSNAEWMLGWIELTKIEQQPKAVNRIIELHGNVGMPISKSRMAFWAAEALEEDSAEQDRAKDFYKKATARPGTFYGQLAISRLKAMGEDESALDLRNHKNVSDEAKETFEKRFIIQCLKAYGKKLPIDLQLNLLGFVSTQLTVPGEEILVTEFGYSLGGTHLAVFVAKKAQYLGTVITEHGYPLLERNIRQDVFSKLPPLIQCFVHGIIRQESDFSEHAVSSAKAKGLMQLVDKTANAMRNMASRYGLKFSKGDIHDKHVNVTLGTTHFLEHLEKYDGYLVLALAAYNAGESNANKWLELFGDPRVTGNWMDWIESIPFGETRNYVQRVVENSAVYAAMLIPDQSYEIIDWISKPVPHAKRK